MHATLLAQAFTALSTCCITSHCKAVNITSYCLDIARLRCDYLKSTGELEHASTEAAVLLKLAQSVQQITSLQAPTHVTLCPYSASQRTTAVAAELVLCYFWHRLLWDRHTVVVAQWANGIGPTALMQFKERLTIPLAGAGLHRSSVFEHVPSAIRALSQLLPAIGSSTHASAGRIALATVNALGVVTSQVITAFLQQKAQNGAAVCVVYCSNRWL